MKSQVFHSSLLAFALLCVSIAPATAVPFSEELQNSINKNADLPRLPAEAYKIAAREFNVPNRILLQDSLNTAVKLSPKPLKSTEEWVKQLKRPQIHGHVAETVRVRELEKLGVKDLTLASRNNMGYDLKYSLDGKTTYEQVKTGKSAATVIKGGDKDLWQTAGETGDKTRIKGLKNGSMNFNTVTTKDTGNALRENGYFDSGGARTEKGMKSSLRSAILEGKESSRKNASYRNLNIEKNGTKFLRHNNLDTISMSYDGLRRHADKARELPLRIGEPSAKAVGASSKTVEKIPLGNAGKSVTAPNGANNVTRSALGFARWAVLPLGGMAVIGAAGYEEHKANEEINRRRGAGEISYLEACKEKEATAAKRNARIGVAGGASAAALVAGSALCSGPAAPIVATVAGIGIAFGGDKFIEAHFESDAKWREEKQKVWRKHQDALRNLEQGK